MRVAVTGAGGRLGRALIHALEDAPFTGPAGPIAWDRSAFDLDAPDAIGDRLDRDRPEVVVHAAAWTDVDGCALDPELALRRNAVATGVLAAACAARGTDLLVISTNEVFAGETVTGRGHLPSDPPDPGNPYGASKAEGERLAAAAFAATRDAALGIARTAWLFGAPGQDFPSRILDAAERARDAGDPLRVVGDEWGTPTYTADVADAIVELLGADARRGDPPPGERTHRDPRRLGPLRRRPSEIDVEVVNVPMSTWERPSRPPRWGVLAQTPLPSGEPMRVWPDAMADYAPALLRARRMGQVRA